MSSCPIMLSFGYQQLPVPASSGSPKAPRPPMAKAIASHLHWSERNQAIWDFKRYESENVSSLPFQARQDTGHENKKGTRGDGLG